MCGSLLSIDSISLQNSPMINLLSYLELKIKLLELELLLLKILVHLY